MNYIYMVIVMVSKSRKCQIVKIEVECEAPVFQVVDTEDNFRRAEAGTARGAVLDSQRRPAFSVRCHQCTIYNNRHMCPHIT